MKKSFVKEAWELICIIHGSDLNEYDWEKLPEFEKENIKYKCLKIINKVLENLTTYELHQIEFWENVKSVIKIK